MCSANLIGSCQSYLDLRKAVSRRKFLAAAGASTFGIASLTNLAETLAIASEQRSSDRPKSLLFLWLQGGPSQLETFDPHPGTYIGGDVGAISTSIKGVQIADLLPATAEQLHLTTLVRSVVSKEGDHERATYHLKTGWRPDPTVVHPAIGSIVCHQSPDNIEIPRHVSINAGQWPPRGGYLGPEYDAFQIGDPGESIPNLSSTVARPRMENRLGPLLNAVEDEFRRGRLPNMDRKRTLHQTATRQAVAMMNSEQLQAFDVHREGEATRKAFGDNHFGRGCLAAIRLLEAGVRCVEVELSGWDSHINNHELQLGRARMLDPALAATLQELERRDLLANTIVFCGGEFGRTPLINPAGGRDHWPHGFSVLLAGGNFRRGHVHGTTDGRPDRELLENRAGDTGFDPSSVTGAPISVPDLHATLLAGLGIPPQDERLTPIGRPLKWSDGQVADVLLDGNQVH